MNQADWLRKRMRSARKLGCAPEIGAALLLALLAAHLLHTGLAHAAGDGMAETTGSVPQKTLGDYFTDLGSEEAPERLFAARAIRAETFGALRAIAHAPADSLASMEARSLLVEIDARLPGACRAALRHDNTVVPCAELLAATEHVELLADVLAARPLVKGKGPLKRFEAAVVAMGGRVDEGGAAPTGVAGPTAPAPTPAEAPANPPAPAPAP